MWIDKLYKIPQILFKVGTRITGRKDGDVNFESDENQYENS